MTAPQPAPAAADARGERVSAAFAAALEEYGDRIAGDATDMDIITARARVLALHADAVESRDFARRMVVERGRDLAAAVAEAEARGYARAVRDMATDTHLGMYGDMVDTAPAAQEADDDR